MTFRRDMLRLGIAACAGLLATSCFDTDPNPPSTGFTEKSWTLQAVTFDLGLMDGNAVAFGKGDDGGLTGETMVLVPGPRPCFYWADWESPGQCRLDDTWKFSGNGTVSVQAGASRCAADEPETRSGTWSLNSDKTELTVALGGQSVAFGIESQAPKSLTLSETEPDSSAGCGATVYVKTLYRFAAP